MLVGCLQIEAFEEDLTHPHVHVRGASYEGSALLSHQLQGILVGVHRIFEVPLCHADVAQCDGGTECIGDVARPPEPTDALAPRPERRLQVALGPRDDPEETRRSCVCHVVVFGGDGKQSLSVLDSRPGITPSLRQGGSVHLDLSWDAAEFALVDKSNLSSLRRRARVDPGQGRHLALGLVQPTFDARHLAARQQRPGVRHVEHRPPADDVVGEPLDPTVAAWSPAGPCASPEAPSRQAPPSDRSHERPAHGEWLRSGRPRVRATHSPFGEALEHARVARLRGAPVVRRRRDGGSGTIDAGRRAQRRKGSVALGRLASPCCRPAR